MEIQIAAGFVATGIVKLTRGFCPSVGKTIFCSVFLCLLSLDPLAGRAEIDDVSHAWSEPSKDARLVLPEQATPFSN